MGCNLSKRIKVRPVVTKTEVCYRRAVAGPGSHTLTRRPSVATADPAAVREGNGEAVHNTENLLVHPYTDPATPSPSPDTATATGRTSSNAQRPDTGLQCASLVLPTSVASAEHEEGPAEACGEQGSSGFNLPGTSVSLLCLGGSSSAELLLLSISSTDAVPKPVKARDSSSGSEVPVQEAGTRPTLTPTLQVHD